MPSFDMKEMNEIDMNENNNFRAFIHFSCLIVLTEGMKKLFPLIGSLSER